MEQGRVVGNATSLLGEIFLPGASQYMAGNVGSGIVHSLLAMGASALLIGSGAAPVIGALAVLGIKLNSYSFATTGRNLWDLGTPGAGATPTDDVEAARLYKLAAERGNAAAQANLGTFYRDGRGGLPQDDREAARLYKLAAERGNAAAQANLATFYRDGRGGLPQDDREAARLYKLAADQGNAFGQSNLGTFYESGRGGLPQDDREAARLYKLAADQGNADAQANLTNLVPPPSPDAARVQAVGGQSGRLQIILAWDDRNDLDLHVVCPNGEEIAYNNKRAGGGELDVDAAGVDAPVENIRFEAPAPGRYQIFVVFYGPSGAHQSPFRVTIRRQGQRDQVIPGIARQQGERQLVQTVEFSN
jgi:hypothetical protein